MGMNKQPAITFYVYIRRKLEESGIWNTEDYWQVYKNHPVSQMKMAIESFVEEKFNAGEYFSIYELWKLLSQKPFGFMRCPISAFLFGFLMKEGVTWLRTLL